MASRLRSISKPAFSFLKSNVKTSRTTSSGLSSSPSLFSRVSPAVSSLHSLLPLHSAVSAARLTSRLGIDSGLSSRAMYQGTLCRSIPGV